MHKKLLHCGMCPLTDWATQIDHADAHFTMSFTVGTKDLSAVGTA